jgi:hypothetical protein
MKQGARGATSLDGNFNRAGEVGNFRSPGSSLKSF